MTAEFSLADELKELQGEIYDTQEAESYEKKENTLRKMQKLLRVKAVARIGRYWLDNGRQGRDAESVFKRDC